MSDVNPFAPGQDNMANHVPEVTLRGNRSSSTTKQEEVPTETNSLLGKTPPPRYSSIDAMPQGQTDIVCGNLAAVHNDASAGRSTSINIGPQPQHQHQNIIGPTSQPVLGVQPGWGPWMPGYPGHHYPPGLEHLRGLDYVTITGRGKKYEIYRGESIKIFTARLITEGCCGRRRNQDATIRVVNNANLEVLSIARSLESAGCCSSSNEHVEIFFHPGIIIGVVQGTKMEYTVHNPSGDLLFIIEKQRGGCCKKGGYEIFTADRYPVGYISMDKSCCRTSKTLRIIFPLDLDLRSKAMLLSGALSLKIFGSI